MRQKVPRRREEECEETGADEAEPGQLDQRPTVIHKCVDKATMYVRCFVQIPSLPAIAGLAGSA